MISAAQMLRLAIDQQSKKSTSSEAGETPDAVDDAFSEAIRRRFTDTDERLARLHKIPTEQHNTDPIVAVYEIQKQRQKTTDPGDPMPLNGDRPVNAVRAALAGPGSTVRTPGHE